MKAQLQRDRGNDLNFCSSQKNDSWIASPDPSSYQWWHFDAVSDDGAEVISIRFYDNYLFSKDYWKSGRTEKSPAIRFIYTDKEGKTISETKRFPVERFYASTEQPECTIGDCSFYYNRADYGSGYFIKIDIDLPGGLKLTAGLEWLLVESDLKGDVELNDNGHFWNVAGFRADVSGRIKIFDRTGKCVKLRDFRGTGYHDHKRDARCLAASIDNIYWGRVHFADSTAIFHRHQLKDSTAETAKLLINKNGFFRELDAVHEDQTNDLRLIRRRLPLRVRLVTDENIRLKIKPVKVIHHNVFETTWLSEMTLTLRDGIPRRSIGISEYSKPVKFNKRLYKWLAKLI